MRHRLSEYAQLGEWHDEGRRDVFVEKEAKGHAARGFLRICTGLMSDPEEGAGVATWRARTEA